MDGKRQVKCYICMDDNMSCVACDKPISIKDIPVGEVAVLVPPNAIGMLCGVAYFTQQNDGLTTIVYRDKSQETGIIPRHIYGLTPFEIVSRIQSSRKGGEV